MKPFMMYIIGISGSGKTTIGLRLIEKLKKFNFDDLQFIDGDVIREELDGIFGYTYEERMRCNKTVCVVASYLIRNDINVILAQVGAYKSMRQQVRNSFPDNYIEVYVKCSVEECSRRDVKGYYQKLKKGEMENFNGSTDVYEIPKNSDVVVDTEKMELDECVEKILECLRKKGYEV